MSSYPPCSTFAGDSEIENASDPASEGQAPPPPGSPFLEAQRAAASGGFVERPTRAKSTYAQHQNAYLVQSPLSLPNVLRLDHDLPTPTVAKRKPHVAPKAPMLDLKVSIGILAFTPTTLPEFDLCQRGY